MSREKGKDDMDFDSIGDLANAVIDDFEQDEVEQTQSRVDYPGVRLLMDDAEEGTTPHRTNIRLRETPSFRWVGLFETTPNMRVDLTSKLTAEAVKSEEKAHFDGSEEAFISKDETRIFDHLKEQYDGAKLATYEGWDEGLALTPINANDRKSIKGVLYYIRPMAAGLENADGDFVGVEAIYQNGATTSSQGGEDRSDPANTRMRNWAFTIGEQWDDALIRGMRLARINTGFRSIPGAKGRRRRRVVACGTNRFNQALESANASRPATPDGDYDAIMDPKVGGLPLVHWPALDVVAYDPLIGIDLNKVYARKIPNRWMKWTPSVNSRDGIDIFTKALICQALTHCSNPRESGWIGHLPIEN